MKAIYFLLLSFYFLSAHAVINQEAQRREAPIGIDLHPPPQQDYGVPSNQYGPPQRPVHQQQRRIQAMQRLIAAMRSGGYSANQARVVNRPIRPIPIHKPQSSYGPPVQPQNTYGPPSAAGGYSSGSGSLHAFAHNHNPGVSCEGWIPIPGPSIPNHSSGGSASSSGNVIDTSYGPPHHGSSNSGSSGTLIVVPEDTYGPPPPVAPSHSYGPPATVSGGHLSSISGIDTSYGVPPQPIAPQKEYGVPQVIGSGHSSSSSISAIDNSYGAPAPQPIVPHKEYGPPHSSSGGHATSVGSIDTSYGVPPPPVNPQPSYGPPNHSSSSGHSSSSAVSSIDTSYGVPEPPVAPHKEYGPPATVSGHAGAIQQPHNEYGPPIIVGSGHASSATAIGSIDTSYGTPIAPPAPNAPHSEYGTPHQQAQVIENTYGPPAISISTAHGSSSSGNSILSIDSSYGAPAPPATHQNYGIPQNPNDFGPPESSYGPPPSGVIHSEDIHHASSGHAGDYQQVQSIGTELQLPEVNSGVQFNNDIGLGASTLGVSGNSEVIKSHAIHESHTSEVANAHSFSSGSSDTYSAPPLDSYAPGKYNPSFLNQPRRPPQPIRPQRPIGPPPPPTRPQYIPPKPMKLIRPPGPPPSFRPLPQGGHAQSIAHSYSSQSHSHSHSQTIRHPPPRQPLIHRQPVPQGLLQSIGQNVQAQDNGHRGHPIGNTYLPPPSNELPIPPMKLVVPNPGPAQPFNAHSHSGGVATSSSAFSLQNHELRNVHVIHDCGKGPQLSQSYGTPLAPPLTQYSPPSDTHSAVLSTSYEVPAQALEVPQHSTVDFNSPSNSYGPPASGPASLDVIGLESRTNVVTVEPQAAESQDAPRAELPGLSGGLNGSGLDFISATKSHTLVLPQNQSGPTRNFQLHIQGSHSDQNDNRVDGPNHQQILADGLLQSILNAIEQPAPTVPQVSEDAEHEHSEAKKFLGSKAGQDVLAEKNEEH